MKFPSKAQSSRWSWRVLSSYNILGKAQGRADSQGCQGQREWGRLASPGHSTSAPGFIPRLSFQLFLLCNVSNSCLLSGSQEELQLRKKPPWRSVWCLTAERVALGPAMPEPRELLRNTRSEAPSPQSNLSDRPQVPGCQRRVKQLVAGESRQVSS